MTDEASLLNLKFCLLNVENLFLLLDSPPHQDMLNLSEAQWQKLSSSILENKPLRKLKELGLVFNEVDADIFMLCEVGGLESLKNFNFLFLQNRYFVALIEGNSERNIDVGFLIRKDLPCFFDLQSNKNRPINYLYPHERDANKPMVSHKFSRDVAELRLFQKNSHEPFLMILLTHLKSRLDPDRIDPMGFERRQAELKTLLNIYREIQEASPELPIIVTGDFNGNASLQQTDHEFLEIYKKTDLIDVLELDQVDMAQRVTFHQVKTASSTDLPQSEGRQLDYCFLNQHLAPLLTKHSAKVLRYKDHFGMPINRPASLEEKFNMPSDHYPLVFSIQGLKLR